MALVSSPSKGIKRDRDGVNLGDGSNGVAVKSQSNAFVNKFYVSFGITNPYDELISQFTSTHFHDYDKLKPWLDALSNVVSQLDKSHLPLVEAITSLAWTISSPSFVSTYTTFVAMLISAHPGYTKLLLGKVIKGLTHPGSKALESANANANANPSQDDKHTPKLTRRTMFDRLHALLIKLLDLVPTLPSLLQPILIRHFPHKRENKVQQVTYMRNLLSMISYCPALSDEIFGLIVDRTIQIDVEIQVELDDLDDELEDETEAIFETEPDIFERSVDRIYSDEESSDDSDDEFGFLSDLSSDDGLSDNGSQDAPMQVSAIKDLVDKLDGMLLMVFEYLDKSSKNQEIQMDQFSTLLNVFERTVLPTFRSRYTQFILFKYSSYDPRFTDIFQGMLLSKAIFQYDEPSVTRVVAASYLASYVSRANFIGPDAAKHVVGLMCDYITQELDSLPQPIVNFRLNTYSVWYAIVQAVFYIFCFRWRDLMLSTDDTVFDHAEALPIGSNSWIPGLEVLQRAILSPLNPLKVCASTVVNQFAKVSQFAGFLYCHSIIESNKRADVTPATMASLSSSLLGVTPGQDAERQQKDNQTRSLAVTKNNGSEIELDSFFPFDPYRLPRTQRFIDGIYRNWDDVAITTNEDEDSDEDSEQMSKSNPSQSLGKSLEAMSISPERGQFSLEKRTLCTTRRARHPLVILVVYALWIIANALLAKYSWYEADTSLGTPQTLSCTESFWKRLDGCGLDGNSCGPFEAPPMAFRCPRGCDSTTLANKRTIGLEAPNGVSLVVGGGYENDALDEKVYRADSWICSSSYHAGLISKFKGGCGAVRQIGEHTNFIGSKRSGIDSVDFPTSFPSSYVFEDNVSSSHCEDYRMPILAFNIVMSVLVSLFLSPPPLVYYWTLICLGYWNNALASEPRSLPPDLEGAFKDFLPMLFVAYCLWRLAVRFCLPYWNKLPIERTVLTLAPFWLGLLVTVMGDSPLDRLYGPDIAGHPEAIVTIVVVVIVIVVLGFNQARVFRNAGKFWLYIKWYFLLGLFVIMPACLLPTLSFRLHHYILALLLLPLTALPTRVSIICQCFLLGLLINGVQRWGMDSVLQTAESLRRDAALGSALPSFAGFSNGTLSWEEVPSDSSYDGFELLVNDVLRFKANSSTLSYAFNESDESIPYYARLAYSKGNTAGDFTKAATNAGAFGFNSGLNDFHHINSFHASTLPQHFPSPGDAIAPPPHPQDYGLKVPTQYDRMNRQFRQPTYPQELVDQTHDILHTRGPYYNAHPRPPPSQPQVHYQTQPQSQPQSQPQAHQTHHPPPAKSAQPHAYDHSAPSAQLKETKSKPPRRRPTCEKRSYGPGKSFKYQYSECSGNRKALCIGINYVGTENELGGCQNDADKVRKFLIKRCGYKPENIMLLKDSKDVGANMQPTKKNMLAAMRWLVKGAKLNDALFFHYSGHGGRTKDLNGDEKDGYDETIYPLDFQKTGHILDDTLYDELVKPLPDDSNGDVKEPDVLKDASKHLFSHRLPNGMIAPLHDAYYFSKTLVTGRAQDKKQKKKAFSPADVIMFAAAKDTQTAADAGQSGAMSYAFLSTLYKNRDEDMSFVDLLNAVRDKMKGKYTQRPQLSSSHEIDMDLDFFTSKQLARQSKKAEKDESAEKTKLKNALGKGNEDTARIYASNAIRKKNEALNLLRLSSRVDSVASRVETAVTMRTVSSSMKAVVGGMDKAMSTMNLDMMSAIMDRFETQFSDLDTHTNAMESTMHNAGEAQSTPQEAVDGLLQQVADEAGLEISQKIGAHNVNNVPQLEQQQQQPEQAKERDEDELMKRLKALRPAA
ncbi:hypothetical protein E3P99_01629 [Wallemia hederae]|uniref:Uncharacterized protein n=1 Tax=Wallemia hederae TaxID=1540922 RepID=A0A4T0FP49_9BASI|nr:hypothetical protein E3P99_01629 [Wallemia hederae]